MICFICEFGQMTTDQFVLFDEELCQCNWYAYPIELQKLLLVFTANSQRPAIFKGYANTECTRDAYKKVKKLRLTFELFEFFHFFSFI